MLNKLYYAAICVANDMKHIHTHAVGAEFDRVHDIFQGYYEKASGDADTLSELALEYRENIENPSFAAELIKWEPANMERYTYSQAMSAAKERLGIYVRALSDVDDTETVDSDVRSYLDEVLRYWKKELDYKIDRRSK